METGGANDTVTTRWTQQPQITSAVEQLQRTTPARIGTGRAGVRPPTASWLRFRRDHAMAKDAVKSEFSQEFLADMTQQGFPIIQSLVADKCEFISLPPNGKRTSDAEQRRLSHLCPHQRDVQIVISDGLSARAIEANVRDMFCELTTGLAREGITCGLPVVVRYGRVRIADQIAAALDNTIAINLVGERPGLSACDSMSAYITYKPNPQTLSSERTVISNIHRNGTLPQQAACQVVSLVKQMLNLHASGVRLQRLLNSAQ